MKTRSNMPLYVVECSDVKALSNSQINLLRCGDYLVKKDEAGSHAYKVAYKKSNEMSLVYCDYHNVEEVYYEKNSSGWHYVSTEINPIDTYQDVTKAQSGTIQDVLGLNSSGKLVKGSVGGGTQLYKHIIEFTDYNIVKIISTRQSAYTTSTLNKTNVDSECISCNLLVNDTSADLCGPLLNSTSDGLVFIVNDEGTFDWLTERYDELSNDSVSVL